MPSLTLDLINIQVAVFLYGLLYWAVLPKTAHNIPLEGMPAALQYVAKFLPNTLACQVNALQIISEPRISSTLMETNQAMRDIMLRGWGIERPEVLLEMKCNF